MINHKVKFKLQPLSYIHIGSGEQLNPMTYIVSDKQAYSINEVEFVKYLRLNHFAKLDLALKKKNWKEILILFYKNFNPKERQLWITKYPVDPVAAKDYRSGLTSESNQSLVSEFIRTGLKRAFIPGSSLKGALRTAIVSNEVKEIPQTKRDEEVQSKVLNYSTFDSYRNRMKIDITIDPFKYLKISDISISEKCLTLKKSIVTYGTRSQAANPLPHYPGKGLPSKPVNYQSQDTKEAVSEFLEVLNYQTNELFEGEFDYISNKTRDKKFHLFEHQNPKDFIGSLVKGLKKYYQDNLDTESHFFNNANSGHFFKKLKEEFARLGENQCIVRIGKGSGQKFCTYEIMNYNPKTRKLIDSEPMGWCKLSFEI